jgi:hypothetical protein
MKCTIAGQLAGLAALLSNLPFVKQLTGLSQRGTLTCTAAAPGGFDADLDTGSNADAEEGALHDAPPPAAAAAMQPSQPAAASLSLI